ncbi:MAG: hypothetical protein JWR69_2952, partial [Pedosphaera sp.]|nr:hypothetical protein [Pedosphaera sp.]
MLSRTWEGMGLLQGGGFLLASGGEIDTIHGTHEFMDTATPNVTPPSTTEPSTGAEIKHLRDLSPQQWKSGIAAWLGWTFD